MHNVQVQQNIQVQQNTCTPAHAHPHTASSVPLQYLHRVHTSWHLISVCGWREAQPPPPKHSLVCKHARVQWHPPIQPSKALQTLCALCMMRCRVGADAWYAMWTLRGGGHGWSLSVFRIAHVVHTCPHHHKSTRHTPGHSRADVLHAPTQGAF